MKNVLKRLFAITLAICIVLPVFPQLDAAALAATGGTVTGLADENIGLSFTGSADDAWSASSTQIIGKARSTSGSGCGGGSDYRSTLTITNKKTTKATLSFDYTVVVSEGTILVNNTTTTTNGSFSKELEAGGTVEVEIESGSTSADTQITMTNVKLVSDVSATVTFQPAENGSYTVDGKAITEAYTNTQSSMIAYQVEATPAEGYRFKGWYDVIKGKCINTSPKAALNIDSNCTITARFVSKDLALFETGGQLFDDLNEAVAEAQKKLPATVTLASSGKISGDYTIPAKVTLLIPFDDAKTLYTDTPKAITSEPAASPFRTLTMAAGSSITLESGAAISVGGQYYAASGGAKGHIVGPYGYIKMEYGSAITVKNGGKLYAWGFISGSGSVTVESGGFVYEWYQILDFRGGSASSDMGNGVFPFSQYAVQNVEVPMTLYAGASETAYTAVFAIGKINPTSMPFIGDNGLFKVASGSLTKAYDGTTDRIIYTVNGTAEVNSLNLKLAGMSVSSNSYVLPFTNNMTVNLNSGSKLTVNQTAALLPGIEVTIANEAELVVSSGKSIYIYDVGEWGGYCGASDAQFIPVVYAPGRTRERPPLADAKVDVNGKLTAIGGIYTTASGADICSSEGTGVYFQQGAPGTEDKTYQYTQKGSVTAHEIPITPAKLHNADGSYTETLGANAGTTFYYDDGIWGTTPPTPKVTVTFDANNGEGTMEPQTVPANTDTELTANAFTREGHDFKGWNTAADGSGTDYADKATVSLTEDTTLYAQWEIQKFTVTWKNWDGSVLETDENVEYGTKPEYNGEEPTKEGDAQYTYTFNGGWTPEIAAVTGDVTYTAVFEQTVNEYTVTWKNYDGTVLKTEQVEYGTTPKYNGATPTKEGDAQYTYTFTGWTPEIAAVTGNAEYTAQFTKTVNKYTVTWKNWDGKVLKTEQVEYGATPEYNGDTPTKPTTEQYTYTFSGWDPDPKVSEVTGDATYTAQFTGTVNVYTITWKNWDGTVLKTEQVEYGTTPKYNGDTPTKKGDAQYTYTFKGWDPEITAVTGNKEYTAVFEQTVNEYTVTWKNGDTVLKAEQVKYGTKPTYDGAPPTKAGDEQYTYTFKGWTPEITAVTGNMEYTAVFEQTVNEYTVTWKNGETVLQSGKVKYGETPTYNGETPTKEGDAQYTYTFNGWTPEITAVTADVTYTAQYTETTRTYTITWKLDENTIIDTTNVQYGAMPTHTDPTKASDAHYRYVFDSWEPDIAKVTGEATYTAKFTKTPIKYTITFDTDGGTSVTPIKQGYGTAINAPAAPTKTGYTFAGWLPKLPEKMPAENMTIKAQWTVNQYTITFNTDGGTEILAITQNYGTDINAPAAPTKTGYTFVKWDRAIPATMPAEDVTITAQWKINQYTITFNTDGGTPVTPITQDYGTDITAPADPTKTGHTFACWDKTIPATMPAESVIITAKWTVNQYTITLMVDGAEQITIHDDYGADISQHIGAINKEGYDFIGWAKEDGKLFTQTTMPAENLVLHACWGINQYTIMFDTDGGSDVAPITQNYGTDIAAPEAPTKEGYTFAGWNMAIPATMPAENVTITAKWKINQYTITFDTVGGTEILAITQDYGTAIPAPADPTKTGYTFDGWNMAIPATMPAENMNITAQWTVNQYTITFDTDGGTKIAPIIADYGAEINAPEAPTKEGYVFVGWDKNIPTTMPAENLSIKAKWKAKKYNITWIVDGQEPITTEAKYNTLPSYGENNPTKTATAKYTYEFIGWEPELEFATDDATYTAKFNEVPRKYTITWNVDGTETNDSFAYGTAITAPADPTKEGYTFTGWMIAEGEALPATMPAKNIVATAQWAKNKYKLTFEAEGYGGEPADVEWGTTIHAPASVSKEGHTLEGWYYTDGEEEKKFDFEADKMPMHDLTLTAKWTINQYTITFDTDGGNTIDSITLDYGTAITAPEAPTKDGYTFKEWSPALPETMPAGDMTVKAIYDYTYTGWITDEKGKTYLEDGEKKYYQKWATIDEQEYYFNVDGYVVTGWQELAKDERSTLFVFDNDGVFQSNMNGVNKNVATGDIYWVVNGGVVKNAGLVRVEVPGGGVYYYFDPANEGKAFKGSVDEPQCKVMHNNSLGLPAGNNYKFGSDGIIEHFEGYPNGIYNKSGEDYYYCVDGVIIANGLMKIGEYYYYAKTSTGAFVCRQSYWITKTNGLLSEGIYKFDEQGRIVFPEEVKNGIVAENGSLYYYVDGKLTGAGLIQIDGDYYYVKTSNGEVVHGRNYWITTNNGLLPVDKYTFDEDGKLINPPVVNPNPGPEPEVKNGIVEEMGSLYYYVDGKLTGAGLIQIDGNYYYVKTSNCEVVHGRRYWITVTNNLLPAGQYKFAQDGKMVR